MRLYRARGFPGDIDAHLAAIPVQGIDRDHAQSMIRVCAETETFLYEGGFSPTRIRYNRGVRPQLEAVTEHLRGEAEEEAARALMRWVHTHIAHPHLTGDISKSRALTEEEIIESGVGWCNEQARVFVALCQTLALPARMCFLFHRNDRCSHVATEVFIGGRWTFFDPTFNVNVTLPSGALAEARELSGPYRDLAHRAYQAALRDYYAATVMTLDANDGWSEAYRPVLARGGDLLDALGIANYTIDGVEQVE